MILHLTQTKKKNHYYNILEELVWLTLSHFMTSDLASFSLTLFQLHRLPHSSKKKHKLVPTKDTLCGQFPLRSDFCSEAHLVGSLSLCRNMFWETSWDHPVSLGPIPHSPSYPCLFSIYHYLVDIISSFFASFFTFVFPYFEQYLAHNKHSAIICWVLSKLKDHRNNDYVFSFR
jgi:hypothetical protein